MAGAHDMIMVWPGRTRFHGARSVYQSYHGGWMRRCNTNIHAHKKDAISAREAFAAGMLPCVRCFPYDPVETWDVSERVAGTYPSVPSTSAT